MVSLRIVRIGARQCSLAAANKNTSVNEARYQSVMRFSFDQTECYRKKEFTTKKSLPFGLIVLNMININYVRM